MATLVPERDCGVGCVDGKLEVFKACRVIT